MVSRASVPVFLHEEHSFAEEAPRVLAAEHKPAANSSAEARTGGPLSAAVRNAALPSLAAAVRICGRRCEVEWFADYRSLASRFAA